MKSSYMFVAALLLSCPALWAGETDIVQEKEDTVRQFNALDYSLQKRYRPRNEEFFSEGLSDNSFLSLSAGIMNLADRGDLQYGLGPSVTLSVGKWLNEYNAIRPELSWRNFVRKEDIAKFNVIGIGVSHMFNLSTYLGGLRRGRFFELSTVEGIRLSGSAQGGTFKVAIGLNLGLNLNFRLSPAMDLIIEPGIAIHTDGIDHSGKQNWHRYDMEYGVNAGLVYNLNTKKYNHAPRKKYDGSTYISFAGGAQFQNSDLVLRDIGVFKALGPHGSITVGHWLSDCFAMQGGIFYSNCKWIYDEAEAMLRATHYAGVRAEAKFDPLMLINDWKEKSSFSVPVFAGAEIGYMNKDDRSRKISNMYLGFTAGLQLKYRIISFLSIYIEPRFSLVPYHIDFYPEYADHGIRETYFDGLFNLNFGIEIDITTLRRKIAD